MQVPISRNIALILLNFFQVVNGYFVHFFAPENMPTGNKHVVFVLDKSGSMQGTKMEQTKVGIEYSSSWNSPQKSLFSVDMIVLRMQWESYCQI